nr:hypothetical protein SCTW_047 [Sciadococcus taiwanensis]
MMTTKVIKFFNYTRNKILNFTLYKKLELVYIITSLLLGFFSATILATILGQTGDWGMLAGSLLTAFTEILSKFIYNHTYSTKIKSVLKNNKCLTLLNNVKIGFIYGLFVDAFKLGS